MRLLVTAHTTSLYVMPEVFNRASSVFLDSPVKRLCRNYLKCEFVILRLDRGIQKTLDARLLHAGMTDKIIDDPINVHFIMRFLKLRVGVIIAAELLRIA